MATDPLWYKDAVIYELHVRSFFDSDGDGAGDFRGVTQKLEYLQDLGVTALWILPFCPSPWRDDGYDISDYNNVHPAYGSLDDFREFLAEAHRRGLRVITELVINHTSDQHAWFQRARRAPAGSPERDFYVWSDDPKRYREARIIFKDFETSNWTWDPVAQQYFWHRFYSHQPDLNFDNLAVQQAVIEAMEFWFEMGVDGLRLDAIPYLYEREGTNCENLPETHQFLKKLRAHVDARYPDKMLLAEANQWPEDSVAYFGDGDECHMAFHFPVMPRLFMAMRTEEYLPIIDILDQTPAIPENCQWAMFLRNHDELTLEMVTDEERDYMYRVYAHDPQMRINLGIRRRLAPLLGNHRRRIELMNALLFSLPGTPVLYYGDELGMGDNVYLGDRNGVRTPMQWNSNRNAGFSTSNPQRLYLPVIIDPEYHYESINVEAQQQSPGSLLWWTKNLIALRKQSKVMSRGTIEFLPTENRHVLAFLRRYDGEQILVVANLSRFPQAAELDLSSLSGSVPVEMFGRAPFPVIRSSPYAITLAPHGFYWLAVEPARSAAESLEAPSDRRVIPTLAATSLDEVLQGRMNPELARLLPSLLRSRAWFLGRNRVIRDLVIADVIPIVPDQSALAILHVEYGEGDPERYVVPVAFAQGEAAAKVPSTVVVAKLPQVDAVVYGAAADPAFGSALLDVIAQGRSIRGRHGHIRGNALDGDLTAPAPTLLQAQQRNTSLAFGDRFIFKLIRKLEVGENPEVEVGLFLQQRGYSNAAALAGELSYQGSDGRYTLGVLHKAVAYQGSAWEQTINSLSRYFEQVLTLGDPGLIAMTPGLLANLDAPLPLPLRDAMQNYPEDARLLGQRTAEMHLVLASDAADPRFAPEPFTDHYRLGIYHGMASTVSRSLRLLRQRMGLLSEETQADGRRVLESVADIRQGLRPLRDERMSVVRARTHGDYHLGQALYTGKDYVLIDFEGDPERAVSERRIKRSPLRDVASMLRSLHYASQAALFNEVPGVIMRPEAQGALQAWAQLWYLCAGVAFLKGYLAAADGAPFVPAGRHELQVLLTAYQIDKAGHELTYELNHRPTWARIPLRGLLELAKGQI